MDKDRALKLFEEALDSFKILISRVGSDSKANVLFLKWPDAVMSYLKENNNFDEDIAILICAPIKSIADALVIYSKKHGEQIDDREVIAIMGGAKNDPIAAKQNLIRLCNNLISKLKNRGVLVEPIGEKK
jgi:hypothetical protein